MRAVTTARVANGGSPTVLHRPGSPAPESSLRCSGGKTGFPARRLFDGMPKHKRKKASRVGRTDRISALPDAMLQHVLSFLQAQEAVQSCVLARRWRYLWKSIPVLRLTCFRPVNESREFMDYLLVLRDRSHLNACLFNFSKFLEGDGHYVNLWIRYALLCQVRVLSVAFRDGFKCFSMARLPVISQNLTNLELASVQLNDKFLDFSSCPSLEELKMTKCSIPIKEIFSHSLKRLSIEECRFYDGDGARRLRISVPSLTSLQLIDADGKTPFLEDMPVLVKATIRFTRVAGILLVKRLHLMFVVIILVSVATATAILLLSMIIVMMFLASVVTAVMTTKTVLWFTKIILERDLRRCPTFSKLKNLSLNEWCVTGGHSALICILQHTPVLENLSLQLLKVPDCIKPVKATYNLLEQSFASENLKIVEVACEEVDERVHNIMKSLSTYGISLDKNNIRQTNKSSGCFNFVCTGFSSP